MSRPKLTFKIKDGSYLRFDQVLTVFKHEEDSQKVRVYTCRLKGLEMKLVISEEWYPRDLFVVDWEEALAWRGTCE